MSTTSVRTLRLLSLLQSRRHWPGTELAGHLGISLRTLRRDIGRLRELGYPVDAEPGLAGGYHMAPGASLPPLVLDDEEAVALTLGLLAAVQSPVDGSADAPAQALGKVINVLPRHLRHRVEALARSTDQFWWRPAAVVDPAALTVLAQACRDGERITFDYASAAGSQSQRRVEPYRLVSLGTAWYLVAFDMTRQDWRTFRIDRMTGAAATGTRFARRQQPFDDAAAFVRGRILQLPRTYEVVVRLHAPAEEMRDRIGRWVTVEADEHGSCVGRVSTDSLDWAAFSLLSAGAEFEVVAPSALHDHLRAWAERIGRAVG